MDTIQALAVPQEDSQSLCRICRLPEEVLCHIFYEALELHDVDFWTISAAKKIARVSKLFLKVMVSNPRLWPIIWVQEGPDVAKIVLQRNKFGPLKIGYNESIDTESQEEREEVLETCELVLQARNRWQQLCWRPQELDQGCFLDALASTTPLLTHLEIRSQEDDGFTLLQLGEGAPLLQLSLELAYPIDSRSPRLQNLRCLELTFGFTVPPVFDMANLLRQTGQLEELRLSCISEPERVRPPFPLTEKDLEPILLPRVTRLHLNCDRAGYQYELVARLQCPACEIFESNLSSIHFDSEFRSWIPETIKSVLRHARRLIINQETLGRLPVLHIQASNSPSPDGPRSLQLKVERSGCGPEVGTVKRLADGLMKILPPDLEVRLHLEHAYNMKSSPLLHHPIFSQICLGPRPFATVSNLRLWSDFSENPGSLESILVPADEHDAEQSRLLHLTLEAFAQHHTATSFNANDQTEPSKIIRVIATEVFLGAGLSLPSGFQVEVAADPEYNAALYCRCGIQFLRPPWLNV